LVDEPRDTSENQCGKCCLGSKCVWPCWELPTTNLKHACLFLKKLGKFSKVALALVLKDKEEFPGLCR
jgi:hypothetical protein